MEQRIAVTRSSMPPFEEYISEIRGIWDDRWLTNYGARHEKLRFELEKFLEVSDLCLFTNGHLALESMIMAFGLTGEVITTPFTFASTTHAIIRCGLTPVFCDIDDETCCLNPDLLEDLITPQTSAILPVHVYGSVCDVKAIQKIAAQHDVKVLYDGAHAFGVKKDNTGVGNFGDATMYSFHATKVFHTIEGGAVAFSDPELGERLHKLQNFGFGDTDDPELAGGNAKMNEFQAAMGLCNLRHIDSAFASRKAVAERYVERLSGHEGIILPLNQKEVEANYAYFPVQFIPGIFKENRDEVMHRLASHNIFTRKYFYPLTSDFSCYQNGVKAGITPVAKRVAASILSLPIYEGLSPDDVDRICEVILEG